MQMLTNESYYYHENGAVKMAKHDWSDDDISRAESHNQFKTRERAENDMKACERTREILSIKTKDRGKQYETN